MILRVTSNNREWQRISQTNAYTAKSNLTRFFFVAGATASNDNTVGNFLDAVGFSQELPPVADDEFSIELNKKFAGLSQEQLTAMKNKISFSVQVKDKALFNILINSSTLANCQDASSSTHWRNPCQDEF